MTTSPCPGTGNIRVIYSLQDLISDLTCKEDKFFDQEESKHFWYRGHEDSTYSLSPSLYRYVWNNSGNDNVRFWNKIEIEHADDRLIEHFRVMSYDRFGAAEPTPPLLWMSIMQHYGTKTRLLDWSEYALQSLYFALENYMPGASITRRASLEGKLPSIWVLKPEKFNEYIAERLSQFRGRSTRTMRSLPKLLKNNSLPSLLRLNKTSEFSYWDYAPLAVLAPYNSERIKTQGGTFIVFPNKPLFFDWLGLRPPYSLGNLPDTGDFLRQYVLYRPQRIAEELKALGMKRSLIYPELSSIAVEIDEAHSSFSGS